MNVLNPVGFDTQSDKLLAAVASRENDAPDQDSRILDVFWLHSGHRRDNRPRFAARSGKHHHPGSISIAGRAAAGNDAFERHPLGIVSSGQQIAHAQFLTGRHWCLANHPQTRSPKLRCEATEAGDALNLHLVSGRQLSDGFPARSLSAIRQIMVSHDEDSGAFLVDHEPAWNSSGRTPCHHTNHMYRQILRDFVGGQTANLRKARQDLSRATNPKNQTLSVTKTNFMGDQNTHACPQSNRESPHGLWSVKSGDS